MAVTSVSRISIQEFEGIIAMFCKDKADHRLFTEEACGTHQEGSANLNDSKATTKSVKQQGFSHSNKQNTKAICITVLTECHFPVNHFE